jgi:hypothetical protein
MIDLECSERLPLARAMFIQLALAGTAVGVALTLFAHVISY